MTALLRFAPACLLIAASGAHAAPDEPQRKVSVTGTAIVRTVPDVIVWNLTTNDYDLDLQKAKESSDAKLRALLGLREGLGIALKDVQTGYLRVRKVYERDRQGNRGDFMHFAMTRKVTLKQRDLKRFDEYLGKFLASAEMDVDFSFESTRFHKLRHETRLEAVRAAKAKAAAMTEVLEAKLGKVLTIEEPEEGFSYSNFASNRAFTNPNSMAPEDASGGTFAPGAIEIRVSVRVSFAIE